MKQNMLRGVGSLTLVYLVGPLLLLAAYGIQRWATASTWEWRERWANIRAFSVFFSIFYIICLVLLLLLLPPFAKQEHLLKPVWQHTSLLIASSLFPPGLNHFWIRWLFALPLAPWFAFRMERQHPRSGPQHYIRVELPGEIPEPEPEPTQKLPKVTTVLTPTPPPATQKPKRRRTTGTTTPKKKKVKPTVGLQAQTPSGATTPSREQIPRSLWDQIDWSKVADDDPTKQAAMAEARRQQGMQIRFVQRSLEDAPADASTATNEQPAEEQKPKKRIDWSQVDE